MKKLTLLFTAFLFALPAHAADITLSSRCTLADAIIAANSDRAEGGCPAGRGADTIALSQDITLRDELPAITSEITIEGNGYTVSGDNHYRIFYNDGGALTINNLTMTKGRVEGEMIINADRSLKNTTANPFGGAIVNWKGTLAISGSRFSRNSANWGGAIDNGGELSITNSAFSGNSADDGGGAIFNNEGTLNIINSSFSGNLAGWGGAIRNGGRLSITSSTFSDNWAGEGGAVVNWGGELSITNSTFSGNWADLAGGAIANWIPGELSIINSIIVGNSENACTSSGLKRNIRNFIQDGSCLPAFKGDPKLGALVMPEDGSPAYFPLLAGSRAIDAADDDYCPATDQIGTARPQGAGCDLGAVEYVAKS